jgi:hypothetical protein
MDSFIEQNHPKYLMVSIFEPHPQWVFDWLDANQNKLNPVMAYPADAQQTKMALILYEIK